MHVAVLGAGVTGMTTAYYLAEQGHEVTVIDRADEAAAATSHANGAQLSYSYTDSLAQPGFPARIPGLVAGRDPAIRVGLTGNAALLPWGLAFLAQCTAEKARENTLAVLHLALESAALLKDLVGEVAIEFAWRRIGKLAVIGDEAGIATAREHAEWKRDRGCDVRVIGFEEALQIEPTLAQMQQQFAAALYSPDDEVGDARAFTQGLGAWLAANRSVDFRLGVSVQGLEVRNGVVAAVHTDAGDVTADRVVVCLGPWSRPLLASVGVDARICPIRGYSLTLPAGDAAPSVSITNIEKRIVFSRLGGCVRIAGFADFFGLATARDPERLSLLRETARAVAPRAADYDAAEQNEWGGFRPVTPDSRPLVGGTRIRGLFLNTGHGVLGWTLACATARRVADAISSEA